MNRIMSYKKFTENATITTEILELNPITPLDLPTEEELQKAEELDEWLEKEKEKKNS